MRPWEPSWEWPRPNTKEPGYAVVLWFYAPPGFPEEDMDGMKAALKESALDLSFEIAARAAWILEQEKGM